MALPVYIPSVPLIPPNAYFRDPDEKVYQPSSPSNCNWTLVGLESDLSKEIKVEVNKSRARKSWDAIWAKPKNWWSGLSKRQRRGWKYLFSLFVCGIFVLIVGSMAYVTCDSISQHISKDWAKYEWTKMDSVSEWGSKRKREIPVLTESAWPTEVTILGLLATSTASPGTITVPFTA